MQRKYLISLIVVLVACAIGVVLALGYYPIATVNGTVITAAAYRTELAGARTYARNAHTTYQNVPTSTIQFAAANDADLTRIVLDTLIENELVRKGVATVVGSGGDRIVADKVREYASQGDLANASEALFGLSPADFQAYILMPQAEREVLGSKLFLEGKTFEGWVHDARASAHVRLYSPQFVWADGQVGIQ